MFKNLKRKVLGIIVVFIIENIIWNIILKPKILK